MAGADEERALQSRQWQNGFWLTVILVAVVLLLIAAVWALVTLVGWPVGDDPAGGLHTDAELHGPHAPGLTGL
ncbi:MAG: hypothetical protein ACOCXJ_05755 [Planctomycetota bacterium]